jgi:hypothetical protein
VKSVLKSHPIAQALVAGLLLTIVVLVGLMLLAHEARAQEAPKRPAPGPAAGTELRGQRYAPGGLSVCGMSEVSWRIHQEG